MARGRRFLGQLVLVLAVTAGAFVGAKLGMLGTREVGASHNFSDVPDSAFYHDFVQFLVDNGITAGCAPGLFCGEQAVTRGQTGGVPQEAVGHVRDRALLRHVHATANVTNTVGCPTGKRPLSGGGMTDLSNLFITDIDRVDERERALGDGQRCRLTGTTEAWALCAPA